MSDVAYVRVSVRVRVRVQETVKDALIVSHVTNE